MWSSFLFPRGPRLFVFFAFLSGTQGDCGPPPQLKNAIPLLESRNESFHPMESVTYECLSDFYNIHGKLDVVTCLEDSQWTDIEDFCEPSCSRPPKFKFSAMQTGERRYYPEGTQVNYICSPGYVSIPGISSSVTCLQNYTWTALPIFCEGKSCGDPGKPENGEAIVLTDFLFMAKVNFTCEEGYTLNGSPSTECILKGDGVEWKTKPPECQPITVLSTSMTFTEGQTRKTTTGDCPAPPNPPHATLRSGERLETYPTGTVLRYTCISGYQFIAGSRATRECLANTKWTELPTFCERKRCKVPVIENGNFQTTGDLRLGETVTFTCNTGHRMLGPNTARCVLYDTSKVDWNREPPYCQRIPCMRPPKIANGMHDGDEALDHYDYGSVITYTCNKDFSLIGTASIACTSEDGIIGKWDRPAPECKVVRCQRPEIANGRLTTPFQATYTYDHLLQFQCYAGYTLVGSEFVKCGPDSTWQPALPTCVKGIFTTTTTSTTAAPVPPGEDGIPGPAIKTTTEAGGIITTYTGSTQRPGVTVPKDKQGSNATAIAIGVVVGVLVLAGIIFASMKYRDRLQTGKNESRPGSSDSYREVSRNELGVEMK